MKKIIAFVIVLIFCDICFAQKQNNNSLLWRIQNNKNENVSYLFGTIHLPQKKFVVYSDSVYEAIRLTDKFYNEIDFLNQSMFDDPELMKFFEQKGKYLDSVKHTISWKNLISRINRQYNSDLDPEDLESFVNFSQKIMATYFEAEEGVGVPDMMLAQFARSLGKETGGLETYLLQYRMLYDIIDARITDTTLDLKDEAELLVKMKNFYLKENIDSITSVVENVNSTYRQIVFDKRNITMADSIAKHVLDEPSFFAIGAGHLGGKAGVIELLRKKGLTIEPIHSENKISILLIKNILDAYRMKEDAPAAVEELTDTKIDLKAEEIPPPPPPKEKPPKVETKPATKKKTKGN